MAGTEKIKYFKYLLGKLEESYAIRGGSHDAPLFILEFSNPGDDVRGVPAGWYYVTDGVADHPQVDSGAHSGHTGRRVEVMLYCGTRCQRAVEVLEKIANAPRVERTPLGPGEILNIDRVEKYGWVAGALYPIGDSCGSIAVPLAADGTPIELLRFFPLLADEAEYGRLIGGRRLESIFVSRAVSSRFDRKRNRVVTERELEQVRARAIAELPIAPPNPASTRQPTRRHETARTESRAHMVAPSRTPTPSPADAPSPVTAPLLAHTQATAGEHSAGKVVHLTLQGRDRMSQVMADLKRQGTKRQEAVAAYAASISSSGSSAASDSSAIPVDEPAKPQSESGLHQERIAEARQRALQLAHEAALARKVARSTAAAAEMLERSLQEANAALTELESLELLGQERA